MSRGYRAIRPKIDTFGPMVALVLASGMSSRFGCENKLLRQVHGESIVHRTVRAYVESGLDDVLIVVGYEAESVSASLRDLAVSFIDNPDFRLGQSRSLVAGIQALPVGCRAAVIGVADQPNLTPAIVQRIVEVHRNSAALIVAPRYAGNRGNPVLFHRSLFPDLLRVTGDRGGRDVLRAHANLITWVEIEDPQPGADVDTMDDLLDIDRPFGASS